VVRVPATTSNLGPGFDTLGLALGLHNELTFLPRDGGQHTVGHRIDIQGFGRGVLDVPAENLALTAYETTCRAHGFELRPLHVRAVNRVPLQAGMGSSATAIVAGVAAAHGLHQMRKAAPRRGGDSPAVPPELDREQLLVDALRLEPHPDNLAPCLYGGFTASVVTEDRPLVSRTRIDYPLKCWVILPEGTVNTHESRSKLPSHYTREEAMFSLSRVAVLTAALVKGELEGLAECMRDRLHEPTRTDPRIDLPGLKEKLKGDGFHGLAISGSGPALSVLCRERSPRMKQIAADHLRDRRVGYTEYLLDVDNVGMCVQPAADLSMANDGKAASLTSPEARQ
jgi:homoserine kinase